MTNLRAQIFATIRPWLDNDGFTRLRITALDAALDRAGIPRDTEPTIADGLRPSKAAIDLIKSFEGCRLDAYPDPGTGGEPITIGWGSAGGIKLGTRWTQQQADERLEADVGKFAAGVAKLVDGYPTTQGEFDALVSFSYNVGLGALEKSTLLKRHKAGDKTGAAGEFGKWINAAGKPMKGLIRRRAAEAALYRGQS